MFDCHFRLKELSLRNKIRYLNHNIFKTQFCKPLIFQTQINWSNRIHSLKYLRYATFGSKDVMIRKSEFVAKTQFLSLCKAQIVIFFSKISSAIHNSRFYGILHPLINNYIYSTNFADFCCFISNFFLIKILLTHPNGREYLLL